MEKNTFLQSQGDQLPLMSYYKAPVSNVLPLKNLTLPEVYELIQTDFLQTWTEKVRDRKASKSRVLPYVTPCGTFRRRNISQMLSYSGIVVIDIDGCSSDLKTELAADQFLRPALIFISPSGIGLKVFIRVRGAEVENHLNYFNAISWYLLKVHQVIVDKSGSDLPRACFLCHDPEVYYDAEGSVSSDELLNIVPQIPPEKKYRRGNKVDFMAVHNIQLREDNSFRVSESQSFRKNATQTETLKHCNTETSDKPSDLLNRDPRVHARAVAALKADGWMQVSDDLWRRPGKDVSHSAKYNYFDREGIYFFTNFSSSARRFGRKGYTDVMIINELEFNGCWDECITQLAHEYL